MQTNVSNMAYWRYYIEKEIGFVLPNEQLQWLMNAVDQTASKNGLSLEQLWAAIQTDRQLRQQLLDTVLIAESRFFRHLPSILFITKLAVLASQQDGQQNEQTSPNLDQGANAGNTDAPFRIWSVGCSAGQEVWSLAMSLAAQQLRNYAILGTDVSQQALTHARAGEYEARQQHLIPQSCQQFIKPITHSQYQRKNSNDYRADEQMASSPSHSATELSPWRVDSRLRQHVNFAWHNVFTQKIPTSHLQQVIICQNVLIYFRQFDQRDILNRLATQCAIGGHIILAPGEGLFWRPKNMRRISHSQVNVWQKFSP
jgi:type IV pilus assembly protein PilK